MKFAIRRIDLIQAIVRSLGWLSHVSGRELNSASPRVPDLTAET